MEVPIQLEDFGQKVDLTRRIREVLLNYPEGTTVLKELIQNADDAGATTVRLCLDRRTHGVDSLLCDSLAQWQGPALIAYNDAVFTEEDFLSISRIGGSSKQAKAWKTGRFGVGFNSVYHLTDLPSFVSGKHVVLFDPQGVYLPNISSANPGKRIEYVSASAISLYTDQFFPYCGFGCDMKSPFHGTLFRFPLRNADQAANSMLSKQAYLEDDVSSMFVQLYEEGILLLLFLKSVLSIEMYVWDVGMAEPMKMYSCSINSASDSVLWHRQALLRLSNMEYVSDCEMDAFSLDFLTEAVIENVSQIWTEKFYVVQMMASPSSRIGAFAATAAKDYDMHMLPWASGNVLKLGRAFCCLPLPLKTGFRVQINGYFEVSSNRRGIWYGDDMDRTGKIRSIWNRLLLEDVVAPSFAKLLLGIRQLLCSTEVYYSLWPIGSFEEPWNLLVEHIYRSMWDSPVLYSNVEGGKWISPAEAFLHDVETYGSKEIGDVLAQLGMPIVPLPSDLFDMIINCKSVGHKKVVTPDSVRHYLRDCKYLSVIGRSQKLMLLEYCLEDLIDTDVSIHASHLPLLPLANGDFGSFSGSSEGIIYFICNELEHMLLKQISNRLIDRSIPVKLLCRLTSIANFSGTNLVVFSVNQFIQLFSEFVPAEWRYKTRVLWNTNSNCTHPTSSWFLLFWRYLSEQCQDLSLFGDWPIMPSVTGHLYRPSRQNKFLNMEKLSEKMQHVLVKIGCKILNISYCIKHPDLVHYVQDANAPGILDAIYNVSSNDSIVQLLQPLEANEKDELRQFILNPTWFLGTQMDDSHIQNSKWLPVYKVYDGESSENFKYSDLVNPRKFLPPINCPDCLFSSEFICNLSNTEEELLMRYYGIERMKKTQFYKLHVLNRIKQLETDVCNRVMLSVLHELPQLCVEDVAFRESLRNLEFVPTASGTLKSPAVLYDPRNEELYALLEDCDNFPSGIFQDSGVLDMLHGLGLKTTVSVDAVIQCARHVEHLMHENQEKSHSRGKVLLSYLEVNALKWLPDPPADDQRIVNRLFLRVPNAFKSHHFKPDLDKFWNELRLISWCPVLVSSPHTSLPWPTVSSLVAPPKLVRLFSDLWLVSASMRILDGECSSSALSHQLGWSNPPGGSVIAAQLLELGKNNEIVLDPLLRQELALAMPRIYAILMTLLGSDEIDIVKAVLEGCRWIWVGDGFATSNEVVLKGSLHLTPYIRIIPVDLAAFSDLFLELGIQEYLRPSDYANILYRMATKKGTVPLDSQEISAATLIAQHLAEAHFYEEQTNIYLPDVSGRLLRASDLVYNDAPWLLEIEGSDNLFGNAALSLDAKQAVHKFVHGNISHDIAEKLGVRSFRRILLAESADSMNLSLSGAAEAFGQHEALTTRLRHILEMYADGPAVLFELVQNAEDAGASNVTFLLDKSHYGTSSLLSPEMGEWQGPALYCLNDSVFSSQDLYAISRIGQESKLEKPFSIGRFGLGFNCVYHFTDIPTFVSGENIVMFDPHACNLPGISPSHPGLRIKFLGRKILDQFPDQFSPFLHFGCDLQHPFPGTLFRFALRTANAASRSQIKKDVYSPADVLSLFSSFQEVISATLLFLRNVKTISIFVKEGPNIEMQLLHHVRKDCINEPELEKGPFHDIFSSMYGNQLDRSSKDQFLHKLSKSINMDIPWRSQKLLVSKQNQSSCSSCMWLTSECLGSFHRNNKLATFDKKFCKFVPWACVATPINSVEIEKKMGESEEILDESFPNTAEILQLIQASTRATSYFEGRAFCFLPLPIITGLPVHINAYFELSSNRRDIWYGDDMTGDGKMRSDWNMYLLEEVVAPAYAHHLETVGLQFGPSDLFFSVWPTTGGSEPWTSLVRKLYQFVSEYGLRVLYTKTRGGQWISTKQAIFPDHNFDKSWELLEALSDAGLPVASVPKEIVNKFMDICPSLHFLTPHLLRTLLIRRRREFRDRSAMILTLEYCLLDLQSPVPSKSFYGLPLIPLSSGEFAKLDKRGFGEQIYVTMGDGYSLLKDSIPHLLVDCRISDHLHHKLCSLADSEDFNIFSLTCQLLENILMRLIPADWQYAKQVNWVPGTQGHPSLEWVRLLWSYLRSSCKDLSLFSNWPILPVENNHLIQLVENSNVIRDGGWSENMLALLQRAGCLILRRDIPIEHSQLQLYVQPSTAMGILNALLALTGKPDDIEELFGDATDGGLHELRSFILQSKWFSDGLIDNTHVSIIKHIPMFESFKSRRLVSLSSSLKWLRPESIRDDLLDDNFVKLDSEKERIILEKFIGIKEPSRVDFYKNYALPRMSEFIFQEGFVLCILRDIRILIEEDNTCKSVFSTISFVQTSDGAWKEPFRLYDPRVPELTTYLHKEAFFPSANFSDPEILETLVTLGLKQTLGFAGLLDCARSVSILYESRDSEALILAKRLLSFLNSLSLKLLYAEEREHSADTKESKENALYGDEEEKLSVNGSLDLLSNALDLNSAVNYLLDDTRGEGFWSDLRSISWCPVYSEPPVEGLPWLDSAHKIAAPVTTRPKSQMWIVSSKLHVLDGECSEYLQHKLGWMESLGVNTLVAQLVGLCNRYNEIRLQYDAELKNQIPHIYSQLQNFVKTGDLAFLKTSLVGVKWVWIGDDFVAPDVLAFDSPVKYIPYMYVVPSELSIFQDLLLALGVRHNYDVSDYFNVLRRLQNDVKDGTLSTDQLNFVHCVLETIANNYMDGPGVDPTRLLIPDSSGVLTSAGDLVYNDVPWMETNSLVGKRFVHSNISFDLANRLGIQSVRSLSLVSKEFTKDFPCMDYNKICELLESHGDCEFLLFDLLELADCCKAKKLYLIFDKREHPRQSLLQHNLAEFQGPALVAVLEGASLSGDEIASLQFLPPWSLRGDTLNYGLGLLSCFSISDLPSVISDGCLYIFDPRGVAIATSSTHSPSAKVFPLRGTKLTERFSDQFSPMLIDGNMPWSSADSTVIRMPLSSKCVKGGAAFGLTRMTSLLNKFTEHASKTILYLKSILQVSLSTWEDGSPKPCLDYSVEIDPLSAVVRNPFSEKKWKKFQLSSIFGSSAAAIKLHVLDLNLNKGGTRFVDRWLVGLSMGSGQTRNMALDRRYLAYHLTPVAGVAAHISRNSHLADIHPSNTIMSPLPLSSSINIPVTVVGCFLVRHNRGRYLFRYQDSQAAQEVQSDAGTQLIEAWNRELMSCVRDSYIKLIVEMQKLRRDPLTSVLEPNLCRSVSVILSAYRDEIYSFWPKSGQNALIKQPIDGKDSTFSVKLLKADWECLNQQVVRPLYARLVELPVWQLYSGNLVKAADGMFLSQPGSGVGDNLLPATVCAFVKEHYPVFSVPWDLVTEIQAVGITVREIKPKMVRNLLRASSPSMGSWSIDTYVDVLEYCLSDIQLLESSGSNELHTTRGLRNPDFGSLSEEDSSSVAASGINSHSHGMPSHASVNSGGDAVEMMTSLGKALFDFGRGVVEDISRAGGSPSLNGDTSYGSYGFSTSENQKLVHISSEIKGLPCPNAKNSLIKLGITEIWVGKKEEQCLVTSLAGKFIHPDVLERPVLQNIFSNCSIRSLLKLQPFSLRLLARHMRFVFHENWANNVIDSESAPWFSWEESASSGREAGPSPEWIRLFWKTLGSSSEDISLFSDWPLIPAFLGRPILCRVRERHLVFIPPPIRNLDSPDANSEVGTSEVGQSEFSSECEVQAYLLSFKFLKEKYPWLFPLLNQYNIPIFDVNYMDCALPSKCLPADGQSLGKIIARKLVAAKRAEYFPHLVSFPDSDRDELFSLFASDFSSASFGYGREELEMLRDLPIYRTVRGTYTQLESQDLCMISSNTFLKPSDERCLSHFTNSTEGSFLQALGIPELHDQQILVKFGLPGYEHKPQLEQEDILIYLYTNWNDLQSDSSVIEVLKNTNFVKTADEQYENLCKPKDLFDPGDALLTSVYSGKRKKFPGERFISDGWLQILRKTGLRTSSESDVILECAKRVEYLGGECMKQAEVHDELNIWNSHSEVSFEIWVLAETLVKTIFSNFAILYGNNFCNLLGKIACVPAERVFPNIGGRRSGNRVLCSYTEAVMMKDLPLAWSSAPILSVQSVVPPVYAWGPLHLSSPPAFSTVLKHLQVIGRNGGVDTLAHWPAVLGIKTVDEASLEVLKYLDKVWPTLSSEDVRKVQQVPFLPAANGTRLVTASSLFARLTINLSPFAFELPSTYLPFVKILGVLGLQDSLSVASARNLLSHLQTVSGFQRLNPNEFRAAVEILHFICDEKNRSGISNWDSEAIVPDDGCRLVHAKSCVYIDSRGSHYVNHIDSSRLRFVHPDLPERLCQTLGIQKLSDVVKEELDKHEDLCNLEYIGSVSLATIRQKLVSESFQLAVWRVLNVVASTNPSFVMPVQEKVQKSLESVAERLKFVQCLYTRFLLLPKSLDITLVSNNSSLPEWGEISRHRALYFIDQLKTCVFIAEPPQYVAVTDVIAAVISQILDSTIPLPIGSLFLCPQYSETALLDILKLCSHTRDAEFRGGSDYFLGKDILPQDAIRVQFHPLRPFYKGEIVAWRSSNGERLKYGRVPEDVKPSAGQALYRFMLEISPAITETLLSSNIFSFKNISYTDEGLSATIQEGDNMVPENTRAETSGGVSSRPSQLGAFSGVRPATPNPYVKQTLFHKIFFVFSMIYVSSFVLFVCFEKSITLCCLGEEGISIASSRSTQSVQDLQRGQVSAAEFVQAVHEMLSSAGINLDVEKQSLLQTTLTLQEQLKESQAALLLEQEKSEMAAKEADTAKAACFTVPVLSDPSIENN
ncbi:sacsin [Phtheirospermum japonicum]|uniref:Sacsin n=1 Tax=Phtheirospermum japonicum TaxID=374723 RepID=A0A830D148_9LAMI|nr:sacsin [Phtheirospermum japonicum]